MIETLIFFNTVEFYVAIVVVAAAVLALCVRPHSSGAVITHLLAGDIRSTSTSADESVTFSCLENGTVELIRHGINGVGPVGAASLCVSVKGFDILIEERLSPGNIDQWQPIEARFHFDFMGVERYHIRYESETTGRFAIVTLTNRPGVVIERKLNQ